MRFRTPSFVARIDTAAAAPTDPVRAVDAGAPRTIGGGYRTIGGGYRTIGGGYRTIGGGYRVIG
ncbi:MAG: hypothetical protein J0H19_21695 [Rhodospirillales bacterium]|nr:hypothetical protein [Rhodospirillales bacterium]